MRNIGALLPFILVLFLTPPAANMEKYALMENTSSEAGDPIDGIKECEIVYNNSGETYRDGIIDNFDHFKNMKYPTGNSENRVLF